MERRKAHQTAWVAPVVLDFGSWINKLRDQWLIAGDNTRVPVTSAQALVLWREAIDRDIFIGEPRVAELAAGAWRLIHEYRLQPPHRWPDGITSEDSRRFREWAGRFQALCRQRGLIDEWTFAAGLPERITEGRVELPPVIALTGFDLPMTPLQEAIVQAAGKAGCSIEQAGTPAPANRLETVTRFPDGESELRAAARWARARMEQDPVQTIAVIVPDLGARQASAERIFRQVFDPPGAALSPDRHAPWHLSLGPALNRWPLVADALDILQLDPERISQPEAFTLLRSPFLAGAVAEHRQRTRTLARVIDGKPYWISARQIAWQARNAGAVKLEAILSDWEEIRRRHRDRALPSAWVARFQEELKAIGFGHGRGLDSREYQVLQRWHDLLEAVSARDLVAEKPLGRSRAVRALNEQAGSIAFRERNPGAPVEILGVEEALGSRFDAAWIIGLDHQNWPGPARRHPLIPGPVQQCVPAATSDGCLARARAELTGLLQSAPVIRGSFSRGTEETGLECTRLLDGTGIVAAEPDEASETVTLERIGDDSQAPAYSAERPGGGTGLLQAQSDCPFRAFAEYRLNAGDLTPRRPGLDARDRGSLIHRALEFFWNETGDSTTLAGLDESTLQARIETAANAALETFSSRNPLVFSDAGRALEMACLVRAMSRWLALEKGRAPFSVTDRERKIALAFGDLALAGKIDRIDELEGGGSVVIDYKTGASGRNGWAPAARLADVQLPAYALNLDSRPVAIAFGRLRPDALAFDGLAEVDTGTPGIDVIGEIKRSKFKAVETWQELMADWQQSLDGLAGDFLSGQAAVDPRDNQVCRNCHLHSLCRINERTWIDNDAEGAGLS